MANSYAGYVKRPTPINWGAVAGGIVDRMEDVEKKHEAFRTKYDTMAADLRKEVDKFVETSGLNPELDHKISDATQMAKGLIFDMHNKLKRREITPSAMNNLQHSLSSDWADFNMVVKNIDASLTAAMEGFTEGNNGAGTPFAVEQYADLMDLKHQNIMFDVDDGGFASLYLQKIDDKGDPIDNGLTSIRTLKNPNNLIFRDVKLDDRIQAFIKTIGLDKITDKHGNLIIDPTEKAGYKDAVDAFVADILRIDKQTLSVLADYSDYKIYKDGDTPPAGNSVAMQIGSNAEFNPLVEDLKGEAEKIIKDAIDLAMPSTFKAARKTPSSDPSSKSSQPKLVYEYSTGLSQGNQDYIDLLVSDPDNGIVDVEVTQSGPRKGVTIVKDDGQRIFTKFKYTGSDIDHDATGKNLAQYFSKKTDISKQQEEYKQGRKDYGKVSAGGTTTKKVKPNITSVSLTYKHPHTNKQVQGIKALADLTDTHAKKFFKDIGIPGVKVSKYNHADDTFEIEVNGETFTIHKTKRKTTGNNPPAAGGAADMSEVKKDVQKVIDWYWNELGMQEPSGEQQIDVTQIGAKYNVA